MLWVLAITTLLVGSVGAQPTIPTEGFALTKCFVDSSGKEYPSCKVVVRGIGADWTKYMHVYPTREQCEELKPEPTPSGYRGVPDDVSVEIIIPGRWQAYRYHCWKSVYHPVRQWQRVE